MSTTPPQTPRRRFDPRMKAPRPPNKTQINSASEDQRLLIAQRLFYSSLIDQFPARLADADSKVRAAEDERAALIAKHAEAPDQIAVCDRLLAALVKTYKLPPLKPLPVYPHYPRSSRPSASTSEPESSASEVAAPPLTPLATDGAPASAR